MAYQELAKSASVFIVRIIISIVILIIGLILGKFIGNLIKRILTELEVKRLLEKRFKISNLIEEKIGNTVKYLIYLISLIIALNELGLISTIAFILLFIIVTIIVIFVLTAVKDFIPNFVSYFKIRDDKDFKKNSKIKLNNIQGYVVNVNWHETTVKSKNDTIYIPNYLLYRSLRK